MIPSHRTIQSLYQAVKLTHIIHITEAEFQENYRFPTLSDFIITENAMMAAVLHVTEKEVQSLRKMNEASNATERELPARAGFENAV